MIEAEQTMLQTKETYIYVVVQPLETVFIAYTTQVQTLLYAKYVHMI